jgi:hypothetical protein
MITRLVLETLGPLPGDRKCFRMINGVLVERTVQDVVPALETNAEGLKQVLDELVKQYKTKQDDLEKWKVRHTQFGLGAVQLIRALLIFVMAGHDGGGGKDGTPRIRRGNTELMSWIFRRRIMSRLFSHELCRCGKVGVEKMGQNHDLMLLVWHTWLRGHT